MTVSEKGVHNARAMRTYAHHLLQGLSVVPWAFRDARTLYHFDNIAEQMRGPVAIRSRAFSTYQSAATAAMRLVANNSPARTDPKVMFDTVLAHLKCDETDLEQLSLAAFLVARAL